MKCKLKNMRGWQSSFCRSAPRNCVNLSTTRRRFGSNCLNLSSRIVSIRQQTLPRPSPSHSMAILNASPHMWVCVCVCVHTCVCACGMQIFKLFAENYAVTAELIKRATNYATLDWWGSRALAVIYVAANRPAAAAAARQQPAASAVATATAASCHPIKQVTFCSSTDCLYCLFNMWHGCLDIRHPSLAAWHPFCVCLSLCVCLCLCTASTMPFIELCRSFGGATITMSSLRSH